MTLAHEAEPGYLFYGPRMKLHSGYIVLDPGSTYTILETSGGAKPFGEEDVTEDDVIDMLIVRVPEDPTAPDCTPTPWRIPGHVELVPCVF